MSSTTDTNTTVSAVVQKAVERATSAVADLREQLAAYEELNSARAAEAIHYVRGCISKAQLSLDEVKKSVVNDTTHARVNELLQGALNHLKQIGETALAVDQQYNFTSTMYSALASARGNAENFILVAKRAITKSGLGLREKATRTATSVGEYAVKAYSRADEQYKLNALAYQWYTVLAARAKEIDGKYEVISNLTVLDENYTGGRGFDFASRAKGWAVQGYKTLEQERQRLHQEAPPVTAE